MVLLFQNSDMFEPSKSLFQRVIKNRGQNHIYSTYMNTVVWTVSAKLYSCFFIVCYIIFK